MTLCDLCTSYVNESYIWGKRVFHPVERPCDRVAPAPKSNEPSEEVWTKLKQSQEEICDPRD
jgi:hypothetical protein